MIEEEPLVKTVVDYIRTQPLIGGINGMAILGEGIVAVHDGTNEWDTYFDAKHWNLSSDSPFTPKHVFVTGIGGLGVLQGAGLGSGVSGFEGCMAMAKRNLVPNGSAKFNQNPIMIQ